jgi:hypothetical protein
MSSELVEKASELQELRLQYQRLQEAYRKILPKVDPNLIDDCFQVYTKIQTPNRCIQSRYLQKTE